jgi:peroxiredoxin
MSRFIGLASLLLAAGVVFGHGLKQGTPAPEIEGKDAEGKALKLSEYKGKVVMLSFWASWCPPCRALFDHEKELVKKFADKPFVLLGVSEDYTHDDLVKAQKRYSLTWRSWLDEREKLAARYRVDNYPTIFLIDHEGRIQHVYQEKDDPAKLDGMIEDLLKKAEKK